MLTSSSAKCDNGGPNGDLGQRGSSYKIMSVSDNTNMSKNVKLINIYLRFFIPPNLLQKIKYFLHQAIFNAIVECQYDRVEGGITPCVCIGPVFTSLEVFVLFESDWLVN